MALRRDPRIAVLIYGGGKVGRETLPRAVDLYLASAQAQIPMARAIGEAPAEAFEAIARLVERARRQLFAR